MTILMMMMTTSHVSALDEGFEPTATSLTGRENVPPDPLLQQFLQVQDGLDPKTSRCPNIHGARTSPRDPHYSQKESRVVDTSTSRQLEASQDSQKP